MNKIFLLFVFCFKKGAGKERENLMKQECYRIACTPMKNEIEELMDC